MSVWVGGWGGREVRVEERGRWACVGEWGVKTEKRMGKRWGGKKKEVKTIVERVWYGAVMK